MAATTVIAQQQDRALKEVLTVLEEHDPETVQRLRVLTPTGSPPNSFRQPDAMATYLCECVASLARLYDQQARASAPKKRGRPSKSKAAKSKES